MSKKAPKIKNYKVKKTATRGNVNIIEYRIKDYNNDDKRGFKILRDIENFFNYKSRRMPNIKILQNLPTWATLELDNGTWISTDVIISGQELDFELHHKLIYKGKLRKIVGFSVSFITP